MAKVGRPTVYQEHYPQKAYRFCAEEGLTDKRLGDLFDVDKATIQTWKREYPEFYDSIQRGKDEYDSVSIEKSLRRRAKGFSYTETTKEPGGEDSTLVVTKKVKKFIPPDSSSIQFFLRNRKNQRWPDKQAVEVTGLDKLGSRLADALTKRKEFES